MYYILRGDEIYNSLDFGSNVNPITIKINDILTTEKLYRSEKKYRTLVEFADDAIVLSNLSGKSIFKNPAFYSMLGYDS